MDHHQLNAWHAGRDALRRRFDLGFRFGNLAGALSPFWLAPGLLLLRRWTGAKHPRPPYAPVVGQAYRPASQVSSGSDYATGNIYYHSVDIVSQGGVLSMGQQEQSQPANWGASGYTGLMPNPPAAIRVREIAGPRVRVSWIASRVDEQAAPYQFDVFWDNGSGSMIWTPIANVLYQPGKSIYAWQSAVLSAGTRYMFTVLARSTTNVYSLAPRGSGAADVATPAVSGAAVTPESPTVTAPEVLV